MNKDDKIKKYLVQGSSNPGIGPARECLAVLPCTTTICGDSTTSRGLVTTNVSERGVYTRMRSRCILLRSLYVYVCVLYIYIHIQRTQPRLIYTVIAMRARGGERPPFGAY